MARKLATNSAVRKLLKLTADTQKLLSQYEKDLQKVGIRKQELANIRAEIEIHDTALEMGCVNPDLLCQALQTDIKAEDFDGELDLKYIDKTTGKLSIDPRTGRPITTYSLIYKMKQSEEYGLLFTDGKPSPSSSPIIRNPWKRGFFNLTEQAKLTVNNPALAQQLKAEADNE